MDHCFRNNFHYYPANPSLLKYIYIFFSGHIYTKICFLPLKYSLNNEKVLFYPQTGSLLVWKQGFTSVFCYSALDGGQNLSHNRLQSTEDSQLRSEKLWEVLGTEHEIWQIPTNIGPIFSMSGGCGVVCFTEGRGIYLHITWFWLLQSWARSQESTSLCSGAASD